MLFLLCVLKFEIKAEVLAGDDCDRTVAQYLPVCPVL